MEVTASTLVDNRWYVFALSPAKAMASVKDYLDGAAVSLKAKATGLSRPQGYAFTYESILTGERKDGVQLSREGDAELRGTDLFGASIGKGQDVSAPPFVRYRVDVA